MFSKSCLFSYLALALAVLGFDSWLATIPARADGPDRLAGVRFIPVDLAAEGFRPLRLAGAWRVEVDDARFGGVSALAGDGDALLALTDSGTLARLPLPGRRRSAALRGLPSGPGSSLLKVNRDSEALVRDPAGRGWWVAFEQWHQLWLYDPDFRRQLAVIDLGKRRWPATRGVEAMVAMDGELWLFPEGRQQALAIGPESSRSRSLRSAAGVIADGVVLPGGRALFVTRKIGVRGIAKQVVELERDGPRLKLRPIAALALGSRDNVEAIAVQPGRGERTRLWLMTDNDFRPQAPTLLVALDLP